MAEDDTEHPPTDNPLPGTPPRTRTPRPHPGGGAGDG